MDKLKKNIGKLSVSELKMLLESSNAEVVNIVVNQLYYLCKDGKTDKIANECFGLIKGKLSTNHFVTEAIFQERGRADILCLDTFTAIEIVHTESNESIMRKQAEYPDGIKIEVVRC